MNICVDQSIYNGQSRVYKETSVAFDGSENIEVDNHKDHPDPFLFSDTKIMAGQGKAIICCVGESTVLARGRKPGDLVIDEEQTFLEERLELIAKQISKYAKLVTILSIVTHLLFTLIKLTFIDEVSPFSSATLLKLGEISIVAIVLLIVAIPEGLPLAVSIAMALSINNLKKDKILIKNLRSVETCAMLHDLCVSKTGTLTKGEMKVVKYQICDTIKSIENGNQTRDYFTNGLALDKEIKKLIIENIYSNTDVRIEINDELYSYEPKGQPLEVGLINFLVNNNEDVPATFMNRNSQTPMMLQIPFDQYLKRKVVLRQVQGKPDIVRVYVKGAPELVMPLCNQTLDHNGNRKEFEDSDQGNILNHIVSNDMADQGLKVLSFAYKDMEVDEV